MMAGKRDEGIKGLLVAALALPLGQSFADCLCMGALDLLEDGEGGLGERDGTVTVAKSV